MASEAILNLFVSSPGDVRSERERVDFVVERLNAEFSGRAHIRTIRWETRYYSSHETFQTQIPEAAACDLVVAIFGARLGSPLPAKFPPMPSGEPYPQRHGLRSAERDRGAPQGHGIPDIYVFRRPNAPLVALDAADRAEIEAQWRRLTGFFETWFRNRSGEFLAAFQEFSTTDEFAAKVEDCLRQWLARRGFVAKGAAWDRVQPGSPFPGLAAFDEARASVFFGRGSSSIRRSGACANSKRRREARPRAVPAADRRVADRASRRCCAPGSRRASPCPAPFPKSTCGAARLPPRRRPVRRARREPALPRGARAGAGAGAVSAPPALLAKQLAGDPDAALAPLRDALDSGRGDASRRGEFRGAAPGAPVPRHRSGRTAADRDAAEPARAFAR